MTKNPAAAGGQTNYITAEGAKRLRDVLPWLWKVERPAVTQRVSDAAAEGDRRVGHLLQAFLHFVLAEILLSRRPRFSDVVG